MLREFSIHLAAAGVAVLCCGTELAAHPAVPGFVLTGPATARGGRLPDAQVFSGFGCSGTNRSPALSWTAPPPGTESLAITAYDPDAPTGGGWWHWIVFNLPPTTRAVPEGAGVAGSRTIPPSALQGRNDFGQSAYGGACPPAGDPPHHYVFTVWALNIARLPLQANASGAMVGFLLHQHGIGTATLTLRYGR